MTGGRFGRRSTACACGYVRAWPNGPCTNSACEHARPMNPRELAIAVLVVGLLLGLAGLCVWLLARAVT
jgi:hypothetical protein